MVTVVGKDPPLPTMVWLRGNYVALGQVPAELELLCISMHDENHDHGRGMGAGGEGLMGVKEHISNYAPCYCLCIAPHMKSVKKQPLMPRVAEPLVEDTRLR